MKTDVEKWFKKDGEKVLKEVGIKKADTILDFGCGEGTYSLPAAKVAGEGRKVFALDKNGTSLNELTRKAKLAGLQNIEIVETSGGPKIPLKDRSLDVALLYDVLHSYYFSASERKKLLKEVYRVLEPGGLLSVYPEHMEPEKTTEEIQDVNFRFEKMHSRRLIHDHRYTDVHILNFRKHGD